MVTDNILIASDTWYVLENSQRRTSSLSMPVNSCCSNTNYDAFIVSIALSVQNDKWTLNAGIIFEQGTGEKKLGRTSIDQKNEPSRWKKMERFSCTLWVECLKSVLTIPEQMLGQLNDLSQFLRLIDLLAQPEVNSSRQLSLSIFCSTDNCKPKEVNSFDFSGKTSRVCVLATVGRYYIFFPGC